MVTRKPLPSDASIDTNVAPQIRMQDVRQALWSPTDSEVNDDEIWGDQNEASHRRNESQRPSDSTEQDVPAALRPGAAANYTGLEDEDNVWVDNVPETHPNGQDGLGGDIDSVPTILRPGGGSQAAHTTAAPAETGNDVTRTPTVLRPGPGGGALRPETNPFKRKMTSGGALPGGSSQEELNGPTVPTRAFSELSLNASTNPWQPALDEKQEAPVLAPPVLTRQETGEDVWNSGKQTRQPSPGQTSSNSPALLSLRSEESSAGWEDEPSRKASANAPQLLPPADEDVLEGAHAWDDLGTVNKGEAPVLSAPNAAVASSSGGGSGDDWNLIDFDAPPGPPPKQNTWDNFVDAREEAPALPERVAEQDAPPALPPRRSADLPPPPSRSAPIPAGSETYQIKNINWVDASAAQNPRVTPILVQNMNGPCPLVALVNALTLTTPAEKSNTALTEVLRSREQVSLGLLLDVVFDELMSERRTDADGELPDVSELYSFLKGLHTGMNVNPRFIPTPDVVTAFKRTSLTHLHPTERSDEAIPGTFEDTREMALYSTFAIPLIHGWLPARHDAVYDAFARQAASYEDAQNLLFREEELEDKLSSPTGQGLTEEEQQIYQDILTIKSFLSISATQLTPWGLDVIRKAMKPGSVVILFRNDHFSTLYRHPQTLELLTLVTDAGYARHDEVVWESLVDVNGEHAEFFSGDFRLVGGASHAQQTDSGHQRGGSWAGVASRNQHPDGWTTVQGRQGNRSQRQQNDTTFEAPDASSTEQEDRDLALALQLQEEEDDRHRREQERRRRESLLSEQYIEQQGTPPRGARGGRGGTGTASGRGGGHARGGSSNNSVASAARRSSSSVNVPTTSNTSVDGHGRHSSYSGAARGGARPAQQQVRSLIPPRSVAVNRPADEGADDAPPSYEHAAKQTPYVPPEGHPTHPASTLGSEGAAPSTSSASLAPSSQAPRPNPLINRAGRTVSNSGLPGVSGRMRQGVRPPAVQAGSGTSFSGKERDGCTVM